jgi:hypothetical protein
VADAEREIIHYFVDEAGDPTLFNRRGHVIVGTEGCSSYFMLAKIEIEDPIEVAQKLNALRVELMADPYFRRVPSMQPENRKTAVAFHAKDDIPEVRREVYKLLSGMNLRFHAVVRDKRVLATEVQQRNGQDGTYRYRENEQYDQLVAELFRKLHNVADEVNVCFAKRGNSARSAALRSALEEAEADFKRSFGFAHPAKTNVVSSTPASSAGLQVVDYYLWALQRLYERREDRFLELIWPHVGEIHDLDGSAAGKRGVYYTQRRPLTLAAFEKK